ncbi:hypothetical protein EON65_31040, partial [archaeon]
PSSQPSAQPTGMPSGQPSVQPTGQPSSMPSGQPSSQPSAVPSSQPTAQPTIVPTGQPTSIPTNQPSVQPSRQPTSQPSVQPSGQPSSMPSGQPSSQPSAQPSGQPSSMPSGQPSGQPSAQPSGQPSSMPSRQPSSQPSAQPTGMPSGQPSVQPTGQPSFKPTLQPSNQPTGNPSTEPTVQPTCQPLSHPTTQPSGLPSCQPTVQPSCEPTQQPSMQPSGRPTVVPYAQPSSLPTSLPTGNQSIQLSLQPTVQPLGQPSSQPSRQPSIQPTNQPSKQPYLQPTIQPSAKPSFVRITLRPTFAVFAPIVQNTTSSQNASAAITVLASLTSTQGELNIVTETIRVVAQSLGTISGITSIQLPLTDDEKATGKSVPTISMTPGRDNGNSSAYVAVALIDSSLWPKQNTSSPKFQAGQLQSSIVAISLTGMNVSYVDISFPFIFSTQNTSRRLNFTVSCPPKVILQKAFLCNDTGHIEVVRCTGEAGKIHAQCPVVQATCAALDLNTLTASSQNLCHTIVSNSSSEGGNDIGGEGGISCRCGLSSDNTTGASSIAAGVVNSLVSADLSNAFQASAAFSDGSAAQKAATLIGLFCALWGATALVMIYFNGSWKRNQKPAGEKSDISGKVVDEMAQIDVSAMDIRSAKLAEKSKASFADRADNYRLRRSVESIAGETLKFTRRFSVKLNLLAVVPESNETEENIDAALGARKHLLQQYIDSLFPAVFMARSSLSGLLHEISHKHPYINLFFRLHKSRTPLLDVMKMTTIQCFLLFMLALLYDINYPNDDGSCVSHMTKQSCLHRKYDLDPSMTYCRWQPLVYEIEDTPGVYTADDVISNEGLLECVFVDPSFSFAVLMYVSMMISFGQCIFIEPLEYMLDLLGSPTLTGDKKKCHRELPATKDYFEMTSSFSVMYSRHLPECSASVSESEEWRVASAAALMSYELHRSVAYRNYFPLTTARRWTKKEDSWQTDQSKMSNNINHHMLLSADNAPINNHKSQSSIHELESEIRAQRRTLVRFIRLRNKVDKFDSSWCLNSQTGLFQTVCIERDQGIMHFCIPRISSRQFRPSDVSDLETGHGGAHYGHYIGEVHSGISMQNSKLQLMDIREVIQRDLEEVQRDSRRTYEELLRQTSAERGFEILLQFVQDVLGRKSAAARIYSMKMDMEYAKVESTSMWVKVCITAFLLCLNGFFFYFTLLRGISKGSAWQRSYVVAWIVQLSLDGCFFETMEIVWFHYFIPSLAKDEVKRAQKVLHIVATTLMDAMRAYHTSCKAAREQQLPAGRPTAKDRWRKLRTFVMAHSMLTYMDKDRIKRSKRTSKHLLDSSAIYSLNAPRYFFVSYQLAMQYPDLVESQLIQLYRNHLPGQTAVSWHKKLQGWKKKRRKQVQDQMSSQHFQQHQQLPLHGDKPTQEDSDEDEDDHDAAVLRWKKLKSLKGIRYWIYMPTYLFLSLVMQMVVQFPVPVQRLIIRVFEPLVMSGTAFFFVTLQHHPVFLGLTCVLAALWFGYLVRAHMLAVKRSRIQSSEEKDASIIAPKLQIEPMLPLAVKHRKVTTVDAANDDESASSSRALSIFSFYDESSQEFSTSLDRELHFCSDEELVCGDSSDSFSFYDSSDLMNSVHLDGSGSVDEEVKSISIDSSCNSSDSSIDVSSSDSEVLPSIFSTSSSSGEEG